jgi:lipoate-protein ligase A
MTAWHLIVEATGRPGAENMGIDAAFLREAGGGAAFLRLYHWAPPCLSFGRNEPARTRYDRAAIERLGLDTVRRPTGGRAVWHEREVTYAVAGPTAMFGSLREAYIRVHTLLAAALRRLEVPAELAERPSGRIVGPAGGACFAAPVGGEIVAGGRKLVGSAQIRERGAFLQHGSILLEDGQDLVTRLTRSPVTTPAATSLTRLLGRRVAFQEVADVITAEAKATWTGSWQDHKAGCTGEDIAYFADPSWTWRR